MICVFIEHRIFIQLNPYSNDAFVYDLRINCTVAEYFAVESRRCSVEQTTGGVRFLLPRKQNQYNPALHGKMSDVMSLATL